jgi:hypothetical protein|tara:strand:- start:191 stop:622 length:432 start_codon:yes stop_codon:yes gene_type:complete
VQVKELEQMSGECSHDFRGDLFGVRRCRLCKIAEPETQFYLTDADFERWKGQKRAVLEYMKDMKPHYVGEMEHIASSDRIAARIGEIRNTFIIKTERIGPKGRAYYTLMGRRTEPRQLMQPHCPTCFCTLASGGVTGGKGKLT